MKKIECLTGGVVVALLTSLACADIVRVEEFSGEASEGFESMPFSLHHQPVPVFAGMGEASSTVFNVTGTWSSLGRVSPHSGERFAGSPSGSTIYTFDSPLLAFGGYFATNSPVSDGVVSFYSPDGLPLGEDAVYAPAARANAAAAWTWNGWASDAPIGSLVLTGNHGAGGFLMHDDLQAQVAGRTIPAPGSATLGALGTLAWGLRGRRGTALARG